MHALIDLPPADALRLGHSARRQPPVREARIDAGKGRLSEPSPWPRFGAPSSWMIAARTASHW
jgi:hypothetical protein